MSKSLMIIESPNKIKTIGQYLKGKNIQLMATFGHLRDLSKFGMGFDKDLNPRWVPVSKIKNNSNTKKGVDYDQIIKNLIIEADKADKIYLSTDPDREGEAIAWHVWSLLDDKTKAKCQRVVFNEITKKAILAAIDSPRNINLNQVNSYLARRLLDREFGYKLSSFVRTHFGGISAGRVQSVSLKFLVDREKEINDFVPESWYTIEGLILDRKVKLTLKKLSSNLTKLKLKEDIKDGKINFSDLSSVQQVLADLKSTFTLTTIHPAKHERYYPSKPLKTSTLQQESISKFKLSSKKVEQIAQKLYEGVEIAGKMQSLITYPRTDQTVLSETFIEEAKSYLIDHYGGEYLSKYPFKKNKKDNDKLVQGAHEAIRPTDLSLTPEKVKPYLNSREYQVYALIWARSLGSLMSQSVYKYSYFDFDNNGYKFHTYTRNREFDGFELLYQQYGFKASFDPNELERSLLDKLVINQTYSADDLYHVQHDKKPPSRYNEASLIQALEKNGIGRPSTYASIAATVVGRDYATLVKGTLIPKEKGIKIIEGLTKLFKEIISFDYTRKMEDSLDLIANQGIDWKEDFLKPTFLKFNNQLTLAKATEPKQKPAAEAIDRNCPECGNQLLNRNAFTRGRTYNFIGCSNYPNCRYTESINKKTTTANFEKLDYNCPKCQKPLLKRKSRFNTFFVGCSGFPKCNYAINYKKFCQEHGIDIDTDSALATLK